MSIARCCAVIAACANLTAMEANAQRYPVKPVRLLVGFTAGSGTDVTGRLVAQKLTEQLGQSVLVENRAGAGGGIAIEAVVKSPPDGYMLLLMSASGTTLSALRPNLPYDLARDLAPISLVATGPFTYSLRIRRCQRATSRNCSPSQGRALAS